VTTSNFPDLSQIETPECWAPLAAHRELPDLGKPLHDQNLADAFYDRLREYIESVFQHLQTGQQLEIYFFSAGGGPILVTQLGYINPNIIVIYGLDVDGNPCSFVVHMNHVELEVRIRAIEQPVKRNTIGFIHPASPAQRAPNDRSTPVAPPAGSGPANPRPHTG